MPYPLPHALAPLCLLRCVSLCRLISSITCVLAFFPLFVSPVGAGHRLILSFPYHLIEYAVRLRLLTCRRRGRCRCSLISSSHHLVMRCRPAFPACLRLVSPVPSHLIIVVVSIVASIVISPLFDTVGRGVRRGASVLSACLVFALRFVPMSIAGSCRFLCGVPSVCLLCRLGCGGG